MKVALAVSPLPGIRAGEACSLAQSGWLDTRPQDHVEAWPVSDAIAMPFVGSGADEVLVPGTPRPIERGSAGTRHFAYGWDQSVLLDYTQLLAGIPREGAIRSSELVGEDLLWAIDGGAHRIQIVLPVPGSVSDLGCGLLAPLSAGGDLAAKIEAARSRLAGVTIDVLVPREQALLGLSGIARSWMSHGMDAAAAQELENTFSQIVTELPERTHQLPVLTNAGGPERGLYAGCGGGIAYMLSLLGATVRPIGPVCMDPKRKIIEQSDLFLYVCGHVGEDLPSGLLTGAKMAAKEGIPVVVVYDSGAIRKGELAQLGLNGAYEIRPELAFTPSESTAGELADLPQRFHELMGRVARTWGWN